MNFKLQLKLFSVLLILRKSIKKSWNTIIAALDLSKSGSNLTIIMSGLIVFYLIQIIAPNKPIYFLSYFIAAIFFFLSTKNVISALLYSLVLSVFSEIGIAGSLFILEPAKYNLGSGWWVSPMTIMLLLLTSLSLYKKMPSFKLADFFILLFFFWSFLSFIFLPNYNSLLGLVQLFEVILFYFLLRIHLNDTKLRITVIILWSMLMFQCLVSLSQFYYQGHLGLVAEAIFLNFPQTISIGNYISLFRVTGTFGHSNILASFLLGLSPFLFSIKSSSRFLTAFKIAVGLSLLFSFSRASWLIFVIIFILSIKEGEIIKILKNRLLKGKSFYHRFLIILITLIFIPFIMIRLFSSLESLKEFGSMGMRVKLDQEAIKLIIRNPIFGVGLNQSLASYAFLPQTNIFETVQPSAFYKIHNTFLEIAAEIGILGAVFFILFIIFTFISGNFDRKKNYIKFSASLGLAGMIVISYVNPFFHTSQISLMFLLSAIILA